MSGSTVFSKFDLRRGYYQIPLSPESQAKTITLSPWGGAYKFKRLAMGLRNAAQSLQKMMDYIIGDMESLFVYMDDLLVHTKTHEEHLLVVEELFRRLEENGLALN